jgi:hypothetical protein
MGIERGKGSICKITAADHKTSAKRKTPLLTAQIAYAPINRTMARYKPRRIKIKMPTTGNSKNKGRGAIKSASTIIKRLLLRFVEIIT